MDTDSTTASTTGSTTASTTGSPPVGTEQRNPVTGSRTVFLATAASTGGAFVELEQTYPPHSSPPPTHLHPQQDEDFTVVSGLLHAVVDGADVEVGPGGRLHVPRGTPHRMWGASDEPTVLVWRTTPALRTDRMHVELFAVSQSSGFRPDPVALFEVLLRFGDEFRLC